MTREELEAVARAWMDRIWARRSVRSMDELHAPSFVDRSPAGRDPTNEGYRRGLLELFHAFPDFRAETEDLVVDPARGEVAIRWTATGTHRGEFLGHAATGKLIRFRGIEIVRIEAGRIVERWGEWDGLDLLDQLS